MTQIVFGPQTCGRLDAGASREWLVTDGLGGYAMGTVSGLRTRARHGLLVVAGDTPGEPRVGLAALDATLTLPSGAAVRLGAHEWVSGAVDPRGFELLERFDLTDGVPRWRWRVGTVVLEREVAAAYGRPAVAVVHRLVSGPPVRLALTTLCTAAGMEPVDGGVVLGAAGTAYRLAGPGWQPGGAWWRGARLRAAGADGGAGGTLEAGSEDLWAAGTFVAALERPGDVAAVLGWSGDLALPPAPAAEVVVAARRRNRAVRAAARPADPAAAMLAAAADAFVVTGDTGAEAVAGYPSPVVRPRDTLAAYEGLFLCTGRAAQGTDLLRRYADEAPALPVEARLWLLHAVERHVAATGDTDLAAKLLPALHAVVESRHAGADGLLVSRGAGKPVAVNALWVNGLAAVAALARRVGADPGRVPAAHDRARAAFRRRFPAPAGWLHAAVDVPAPPYPLGGPDRYDDDTLRADQLLAWSLPYAPMDPGTAAVGAVGAALLTPLGLRALSEDAPVRPWLLGAYANAAVRAGLDIGELFLGIESHLIEFGLGSVSEAADGKPPHAAAGRPFQAWSVGELLRVRGFDHPSF